MIERMKFLKNFQCHFSNGDLRDLSSDYYANTSGIMKFTSRPRTFLQIDTFETASAVFTTVDIYSLDVAISYFANLQSIHELVRFVSRK